MNMNCHEMLKALNEYVDGTLPAGICEQFEQHLAGCNPCQIVVDNIRKTITLYKNGQPYELPAEVASRLRQCLRERWRQKQGS
jgi:anti-sigma factor RsiW